MRIQKSIEIKALPEKIWPFLVEPENILKWCLTFKKFEYSSDKNSGTGITFYVEEKASGPLMKLNFIVTEWIVNEKLAFKMTSGTGVKEYRQVWSLKTTSIGSTFTFFEEVVLPLGFIGKLIGTFLKKSSEAHVDKMLTELKNLSEV